MSLTLILAQVNLTWKCANIILSGQKHLLISGWATARVMRIWMLRTGRESLALLLFALAGCSDELGKTPYVPGSGYSCTVAISVTNQAVVGEWVPLLASRTSGPWVQVPRAQVTNLAAAYPTAPPGFQTNVQAELTWQKVRNSAASEESLRM